MWKANLRAAWYIAIHCSIYCSALKPQRIDKAKWITSHIPVGIQSTGQPNRIAFDIPPKQRIVITEVVLVQPGFFVEILPRKAQRIIDGVKCDLRFTKGLRLGPPRHFPTLLKRHFRRTQMAGTEVAHAPCLGIAALGTGK